MAESENQNPHSNPSAPAAPPARLPRLQTFLRNHGITLVLLAAFAYLWMRPPATVTAVNRPAPAWAVQLADGRTLTSEQLRGKLVLINYWATCLRARTWLLSGSPGSFVNSSPTVSSGTTDQYTSLVLHADPGTPTTGPLKVNRVIISNDTTEDLSAVSEGGGIVVPVFVHHMKMQGFQ